MFRATLSALLLAGCVGLAGISPARAAGKLVREYDLTRSLSERRHGGPTLLAKGAALGPEGARFAAGTGFEVEDVGVSDGYGIEMTFRADQVEGYRKLIDFKSRTSDEGLYIYSGALSFYGTASGGAVQAGKEYRVMIERDPNTTLVRVLLNDLPAFQFEDPTGAAIFDNRHAVFFQDDTVTGGEETGGTLRSLRVWSVAGDRLPRGSAAAASRLLHDYRFRAGLEDAAGGPVLVPEGSEGTGLHFEAGKGFHLQNTGVTDDYAVELICSLDEMSGYRKLIDFKNRAQDDGLYVYNGHLVFYGAGVTDEIRLLGGTGSDLPEVRCETVAPADPNAERVLGPRSGRYTGIHPEGGPMLQPGHTYHIRIERNGGTRRCRVLLDGQQVLQFADDPGMAVFENGQAYFFMDDSYTTGEESAGTVSRIQIWGSATTARLGVPK